MYQYLPTGIALSVIAWMPAMLLFTWITGNFWLDTDLFFKVPSYVLVFRRIYYVGILNCILLTEHTGYQP